MSESLIQTPGHLDLATLTQGIPEPRPTRILRPLGDTVVFKMLEADMTPGGLHVPANVDGKRKAIVVAVGPGRVLDSGELLVPEVKPGDQIALWPNIPIGGCDFTGEALRLVKASDIAAVVQDAPPVLQVID